MMQAWVVEGTGEPTEVMTRRAVEVPDPGPGFLRLRVDAAALGLPDVLMCRDHYALRPDGPFTPGQEIVGTVTAVGEGVDPSLVGTRQMGVTAFYLGHGGFADEALAGAATMFPAPDDLADVDAAGFHIPFHTGWIGLHERGALQAGEHLVVLGAAGGSGAAAVQLGGALGAHVIAVAGGADKAAYCASLGADDVIDHRTADVADAIRELTDGHGADAVYDPVGGEAGETAAGAMASGGRFLLVGYASGSWTRVDPAALVNGNFSMMGVYAGAYHRAHNEAAYKTMFTMLRGGSLASVVTRTVGFAEIPRALDELAGRAAIGKFVALPG